MLALLANPSLPQPALLDAILFAETGHLSPAEARTAVSPKGAVGPYQFMQKFLPDFGYGMPLNIPLSDVQDPTKARALADRFITGYSDYHQFKTPLQKLVAYNAGPDFAAKWVANGEVISQLPAETQGYIRKAASFLAQNTANNNTVTPEGTQDMAVNDYPESRRLGATQEEIDNARRRGVEDRGLAAILEVRRMTQTADEIVAPPASVTNPVLIGDEMGGSRVSYNTGQPPAAAGGVINSPPPIANVQSQPPAALASGAYAPNAVLQQVMTGGTPPIAYPVLAGDEMGGSRNFTPYPVLAGDETGGARTAVVPTAPGMLGDEMGGGQAGMNFRFSQPRPTPVATTPSRNRRDMSAMSMVPPPSRISQNEMLIRMGAAGLRGAQTSGLESLAAMGDAYAGAQDANRAIGLAQYQAQMDALAKGKDKKDAADDQDTQNRIGQIDEALFDMDRAMGFLTQEGASVTGLLDSTLFAAFDRATGNPDRARRLLLEKLRVDDALLRIAQTKGAISNKEMDLFLAPAPSMYDDESTWITWITDRQQALRSVRSRLATGTTAAEAASSAQLDRFSGDYSEADAIAGYSS